MASAFSLAPIGPPLPSLVPATYAATPSASRGCWDHRRLGRALGRPGGAANPGPSDGLKRSQVFEGEEAGPPSLASPVDRAVLRVQPPVQARRPKELRRTSGCWPGAGESAPATRSRAALV